jgi:hypothetical protein
MIAGALLAAIVGAPALAETDPGLTIVTPTSPAAVDFERPTGGQPSATLTIGLANGTSAPVTATIHLRDTASTAEVALGAKARDALSLALVSGDLTIGAHDTSVLTLTIALPPGADASKFNGLLTVAGGTAGPATLILTAKPVPPVADGATVEPSKVTMTATRGVPSLFSWTCDCWAFLPWYDPPKYVVSYSGLGTVGTLPSAPPLELSSDTGGRLVVRQDGPPSDAAVGSATIVLVEADRAGTYTGSLALDPAVEKGPSVDLTVNVQDFFLYPLLFLIAGAGLGWWLGNKRDRDRPKDVLVYELAKIRTRYLAAYEGSTKARRAWLPNAFTIPGHGQKPAFEPIGSSLGDVLYRQIRGARTLEDLTGPVTKGVTDLGALVDAWIAAGIAADALAGRLKLHRQIDPEAGVFDASDELLRETSPFVDPVTAQTFVQQLKDQSEAIETFAVAFTEYQRATADWSSLKAGDQRELAGSNPVVYWADVVHPARTLKELRDAGVVIKLQQMDVEIDNRLERPEVGVMNLTFGGLRLPLEDVNDMVTAIVRPADRRSPETIELDIEHRDLFDFWVVAAITTLAFFLTLYVDKSFGSGWQYLAAFLAGASGELIINWKLLPWYRSYRSTSSGGAATAAP